MQRVAFLFLAALVALTVPLRAAENPVGTWVGITEVPDQGADEVTLTIAKSDGGYTGTMTDSLGKPPCRSRAETASPERFIQVVGLASSACLRRHHSKHFFPAYPSSRDALAKIAPHLAASLSSTWKPTLCRVQSYSGPGLPSPTTMRSITTPASGRLPKAVPLGTKGRR